MPSVWPMRTPDGFGEAPRDRRSLWKSWSEEIKLRAEKAYQTLRNVSSEALTRTLPEPVSAQQQLLTSSSCAEILTVLLLANRSYTFVSYEFSNLQSKRILTNQKSCHFRQQPPRSHLQKTDSSKFQNFHHN